MLIGCYIKAIRKHTIGGRWDQFDGSSFDDLRAMLAQAANDVVHTLRCRSKDINAGITGVMPLFANFDFAYGKNPAAGEDFIQYFWQNEGIDNMSTQFNLFGEHTKP